jgi:hypothetical protein
MIKRFLLAILATAAGVGGLQAQVATQLALTEVMTQESTNNTLGKAGDWWELSNFGSSDIDLTGYRWNDDAHGGAVGADPTPFSGVTIHAGESVVVAETNSAIPDATTFREWWGISPSVQVLLCPKADPGLSASGDEVRVWGPGAAGATDSDDYADLVDRVDVGVSLTVAIPTFIYDTNNGTFDWFSTNGVRGAFKAATSDEVGSPGVRPNAGRIVITQQPSPKNFTAPVGIPVSYTVSAFGLPKPRFIWLFNGSTLNTNALGASISFAITNNQSVSTLTIPSVQNADQGTYSVIASNGVGTSVLSSNAVLTVTTSPLAPQITSLPQSLWAYPGQNATFSVDAYGSPSPTFQWKFNGTNLPGATSPQLQFSISDTNATGLYTVGITNSAGNTNVSATLTVTPKPNLRITEVMTDEAPGGTHNDWWELSNLGTFPVSLLGFRFDGNPGSLVDAYTITNNTAIAPNESIVLVEDMTLGEFEAWWGTNQLPSNLQIITYHGSGLSFSKNGDTCTVWNAAAGDDSDYLDAVGLDVAENGVSFTYEPSTGVFAGTTNAPGGVSVPGYNGAFVAAVSGDIGSPGRIVNTPQFTGGTRVAGGFTFSWVSQPNMNYTVQYTTNLSPANWISLTTTNVGNTNLFTYTDTPAVTQRFYRAILNH